MTNLFSQNAFSPSAGGISQATADGRYAQLGAANVFTAKQTIAQGTANTGVIASSGFSLTGSNATSMASYSGTLNTSGVPSLVDYSFITTSFGTGTSLFRIRAGLAGTTDIFKIADNGGVWVMLAPAAYFSGYNYNIGQFITGTVLNKDWYHGWSSSVNSYDPADLIICRRAAAYLGLGAASVTPLAQTLGGAEGSGSNVTGGILNIGTRGTGTGTGGTINFQTHAAGSSGSTLGTLVTSLSVSTSGVSLATAVPLRISSGTNQRAGDATLVGGTVTVSNTTVTANTKVYAQRKATGGTIGMSLTYTISAGSGFTLTSDNVLDTSTYSYILIEVP